MARFRHFHKRLQALAESIKNVKIIELAYDMTCDNGTKMKKGSRLHVLEVTFLEDGTMEMHVNCPLGKDGVITFKNEKSFDHYIIR